MTKGRVEKRGDKEPIILNLGVEITFEGHLGKVGRRSWMGMGKMGKKVPVPRPRESKDTEKGRGPVKGGGAEDHTRDKGLRKENAGKQLRLLALINPC